MSKRISSRFILVSLVLCLLALGLPFVSWAGSSVACGQGFAPCGGTTFQGPLLFNSQTTGAATTAVPITIAAFGNARAHVYSVEARCNTAAATSGLTITDGGTAIWSTVATEVIAATNFRREWSTGLTSATNSAIVITLAACTAGTGTLIVQADRW